MTGRDPWGEVDAALGLGRGDSDLLKELCEAGMPESAARLTLEWMESGWPASDAVDAAAGMVRAEARYLVLGRAKRVLNNRARVASESRSKDEDLVLRGHLRAALSAARGSSVSEAQAQVELDRIGDRAVREGQSRLGFKGMVWEEIERLGRKSGPAGVRSPAQATTFEGGRVVGRRSL